MPLPLSPSPAPPLPQDPVITGVGCVTPLGRDRETTWQHLLDGARAGRRLRPGDLHGLPFDAPANQPLIGAPASHVADTAHPSLALLRAALADAARQATLAPGDCQPRRAGCVVGSSKGEIVGFGHLSRDRENPPADPWTSLWPHAASSAIARDWRLAGPCLAPVAACATGLVCVLRAAELIEHGLCDLVIAGSADASLHPAILAAFRRLGVLSSRFDDPAGACRPFQRDRDGFLVGEGAAVFVIERRDHAEARGAAPLARWLGGSLLSDPSGLTRVDPTGQSLTAAIQQTLARSGLSLKDVGHINLHGTATITNDLAEAASLRDVFGNRLETIPCLALKPALGHLLGAAGAVELAVSTLAVARGELPPTAVHGEFDPDCALPLFSAPTSVTGCGLKISLGFGGHVAVGCLGPP